ncbi:hypothetical protein L6452_44405 [Arctium lappa]|uniref:Uncharacterized protein n=1 Tax=Arctium lappa TaxID=4217 RepID=A0ACB8XFJ2_ARCLA|nr:hypothetical protein L6452_44405 [Arctium lappa]
MSTNRVGFLRVLRRTDLESTIRILIQAPGKKEFVANGGAMEEEVSIVKISELEKELKDQREQFFKEMERFISFVEKQKDCIDCKQRISEFMLSDLQSIEHFLTQVKEKVDGVGINSRVSDSNLQPGPSASFANGSHPEDSQSDEFLKSKVAKDKISNGTPQQDRERGNGDHEIGTPEAQEEEEVEDSEDEVEHPDATFVHRMVSALDRLH